MEKSLNNKDLRKNYKAIRDGLSESKREQMSQAITENVLALLESDFKGANIFLCFYPFGSEASLLSAYKSLLNAGKSLYFPVSFVDSHELTFYKVSDLTADFESGAYGIMEPKRDLEILDLTGLDLDKVAVFTPGLIFDKMCNRLGYGAGYYDRFFAKHPNLSKIGIGFGCQITDTLNVEAHDVPLDYIVTDDGLIKRGM
jgi:5-formyltetrahydrofolate cyclo-ligase